ncbi:uncharacterized protein LOC124437433 [Xenia sp. Carnegie-2017]|uniref:uncharacterized protein LOC124437433 n=1 Tax=Xenia sp. Carnegie-2017 TaxID=2897299 RepID=UPI001F039FD1|nr:uncharacterized protein LOC124437433 [Xenia sp. Carnegie-2017]
MTHLVITILFLISSISPLCLTMNIVKIDDYDPGSCNKTNAFKMYSVKDRNGEMKLWICSKDNGKYLWKPVNGKAFVGEYLNPGYDCSDILNRKEDVQDGYYWIDFGGSNKRKVWCDMKTDGGGFTLVARKQDAVTWDIPSVDKPVHPFSKDKYWTSQLGDAPILDFRIQLSTSDSFKNTKAHWFYRLRHTRKLKNLMITDRGCSDQMPGIGDIAYVKDLITEKITTRSFKCSVFGPNIGSHFKVGWSMMNECLKKPCSGSGYLHLNGQKPIKFQYNGAFSYSASNARSGVFHNSTAYLGCYDGTCCGCFGPPGGTDNYCGTKCNAINGGSIINSKNIYTWIWVRSNLHKRLWNKCMEYQSEDEFGQMQWFILKGDSVVPKKGRCHQENKLRLNSGVVVVPDNKTEKKVPKIPGLLEYRLDQKKLYVRSNKTWNILSQEMEVNKKLEAKFDELMKKIEATDAEWKRKMNLSNEKLQNDLKAISAELKKIKNENAKLKTKLVFSKPNYNEISLVCGGQYKWLKESTRRYDYTSPGYYCDQSLSGWHRFGGSAGTQMFSGCIKDGKQCGTQATGYLTGGHPGVNDGIVERTVCFSFNTKCCMWRRTIKVLNCGSFYVYKINGIPHCTMRYCSTG